MDITVVILAAIAAALALALVLALVLAKRASPVDLTQATEHLLTLAEQRLLRESQANTADLDTKKQLIDQQLQAMKSELERVTNLVQTIEKDREAKFGSLETQLKAMGEQTLALTTSTNALKEALSSSRARGQWGERMAEDILRLAGLVEGINYEKQATIAGAGSRPDFVFLLPGGLRMNMDVKFPLDNYLRSLEASGEPERAGYEKAFVRDVRNRIKEITTREYIDPEGGTVDYALLFIPNESVYAHIHQVDDGVLEAGLRSRIICCSPLTLFAVLAVVRQAVDNFNLQKASDEILKLLGRFGAEWERFKGSMDSLGRRLMLAQQAYDETVGVRTRQLERPLGQIQDLLHRRLPGEATFALDGQATLPLAEGPDGDTLKDVPPDKP